MAELVGHHKSPRHAIPFKEVPTIKGSMYGGSIVKHPTEFYGPILDCVYEMADQIANGNGETHERAIEIVLKDEGWRVLPKHKKQIIEKLRSES